MATDHMPRVIGLCPDPSHTGEFYMPHGGECPYGHLDPNNGLVPLVEYVPRSEVESLRAELDKARDALETAKGVIHAENRRAGDRALPRTENRAYDLRQRLDRAIRWLRDAEDIARLEMPAWPTADRIRSIYEQVTEDVLNGRTVIPPVLERLRVAEAERDHWENEARWWQEIAERVVVERDRAHEALRRIADTGTWPDDGRPWKHWRTQAREALSGAVSSVPSDPEAGGGITRSASRRSASSGSGTPSLAAVKSNGSWAGSVGGCGLVRWSG